MKIEHVKEQKPNLKIKIKHVEEQINLQKLDLTIKVEEGSETYIINQTYNRIFKSI
jgi:hypothetical protein